ncbi:MAG: hypothetical protein P8Z38_06635 [Robiginitalea sp.]
MSWKKCIWGILLLGGGLCAQEVDPDLLRWKERMDSITGFQARVRMEVDISFVNMPVKYARVSYRKGEAIRIASEDFVMIPKRGLDLTLNELYEYPFMTLNLGKVRFADRECEMIKVIPTTDKSDYSIATLWLDTSALRILRSQISTKKNGVFDIVYRYTGRQQELPSEINVEFAVSGVKIPLRFLGKDTQVDREGMKGSTEEKGAIILQLEDVQLSRIQ